MPIKVLLVLDGAYRFEDPAERPDFTYTTLVGALTAAGIEVTRAHREMNGDGDIPNFNFSSSVNLLEYDLLWLIGWQGRNDLPGSTASGGAHVLQTAEMGAITAFMNAGGGVFATGDHDSIGADMCGYIPRVRTMRAWFGEGDGASPMPATFPRNFPFTSAGRADTVQKNPLGDYDLDGVGGDDGHVYFENQSDSVPQPITPSTSPAHPILRHDGHDVVVFPDHMHEGKALGVGDVVDSDHYAHTLPPGVAVGFVEFPGPMSARPEVIATGQVLSQTVSYVAGPTVLDSAAATPKPVNTLSVYDGRAVGVGRVVTGATFHHYVDLNLTGDSGVDTKAESGRAGPDAVKGQGFNYSGAESTFADIKAVFVNIAKWLARPRPAIEIILERSTFSQDEAGPGSIFAGAVLVTVDGLKPNQFPGGPIDLSSPPSQAQIQTWAPSFSTPVANLHIEATGVDTDAPGTPDRVQRFTFTYQVRFQGNAFNFPGAVEDVLVEASLASPAVAAPLTDSAVMQLIKAANPYMLDLDHPDAKVWLSSDVRVFHVIEDTTLHGVHLPANASKAQAYTFIQQLMSKISVAQFKGMAVAQPSSVLSSLPTTMSGKKVYNFAIARVRVDGSAATASQVRVFFRIFTTQTTAALTYKLSGANVPLEGYLKSVAPIAIPGTNAAGDEWLSFPCFAEARIADRDMQPDGNNVDDILPGTSRFFGALIDNTSNEAYVPPTPVSNGANVPISSLLMGEHQCIVAQIEYAGAPIPDGALPSTSDKLAQRNLALSVVANPGLDASRMALHTFEIEATPGPISETLRPDELLLEWTSEVPDGTYVSIYIPTWNAHDVVALADRVYAQHEIRAEDDHTVILPGGGTRYVPIPRWVRRQCGVLIAEFPLGVQKGQRFDLAVRQVTNRRRVVAAEPAVVKRISVEEARKLLAERGEPRLAETKGAKKQGRNGLPRGGFDLGNGRVLVTDLSVFDMAGDGALVIQHPDPEKVEAARRKSSAWRETIGGFQLGVPVSVKADMLAHHMRLLSVLRWRFELLRRDSRWYAAFRHYVELLAKKVQALGGDPFAIRATPDGEIGLPRSGGEDPAGGPGGDPDEVAWPSPAGPQRV